MIPAYDVVSYELSVKEVRNSLRQEHSHMKSTKQLQEQSQDSEPSFYLSLPKTRVKASELRNIYENIETTEGRNDR